MLLVCFRITGLLRVSTTVQKKWDLSLLACQALARLAPLLQCLLHRRAVGYQHPTPLEKSILSTRVAGRAMFAFYVLFRDPHSTLVCGSAGNVLSKLLWAWRAASPGRLR